MAVVTLAGSLGLLVSHDGVGGFGTATRTLDLLGGVLAACASLPLIAWRRAPLGVFAALSAASIAINLLGYPPGPPLGPTIALYLLAASRDERRPWNRNTTLAVVGVFLAHVAASGIGHHTFPIHAVLTGTVAWTAAWFAGERTRLRRERIAELEARAERAERDAERERRLAAAEERAHLARDLHDSAGHAINVIAVQAGAARLLHERDPARSRAALETIEEVARQTVGDIDQIVRGLREGAPAGNGARTPVGLAGLGTLVAQHAGSGLDVSVATSGEPRPLSAAIDAAAFRILQEALTNAARHGTGAADVEVAFGEEALALTVVNPTAPGQPARGQGGHGLTGMRERATLLGGSVDAGPSGEGFRVAARLPYAGT